MPALDDLTIQLPDQPDGLTGEESLTPSQQAALDFFEANRAAIWTALCEDLQATVEGWEAEEAAAEDARQRDRAEQDDAHSEQLYGEHFDDGRDNFSSDLFDEVEEESDSEDEDEDDEPPRLSRAARAAAFRKRFSVHTLILMDAYRGRPGQHLLGFRGGCDWDEEHGLGVAMDGLRVIGLGDYFEVR